MSRYPVHTRYTLLIGMAFGMFLAGLVVPLTIGREDGNTQLASGSGAGAGQRPDGGGGTSAEDPQAGDASDGAGGPGGVGNTGATGSTSTAGTTGSQGTAGGSQGNGGSTDVGVTADSVKIGILAIEPSSVGGLASGSFADESGLWTAMLADAVRQRIHGRRIEPVIVKYDGLSNDAKLATCRQLTEQHKVFAVVNNLGFSQSPQLCFAKEHDTPFIWGQGIYESYLTEAPTRLLSVAPTLARGHRDLVRTLHQRGALRNQVIGVLDHEFDGEYQDAQVVPRMLEQLGYSVAQHTTLSSDLGTASTQIPLAASQMRSKGVTLIISTAVGIYTGQFAQAAVNQGWSPYFWSNDAGANTQEVAMSAHPSSFRGSAFTAYRVHEEQAGMPEPGADAECAERYRRNSGKSLKRGDSSYETVIETCALVVGIAAALELAGPALTRDRFSSAWQSLGDFTLPFYGASVAGNPRPDLVDQVREVTYSANCRCWKPAGPFRGMTG